MIFRKAIKEDIENIAAIYAGVCACDAQRLTQVGWRRNIYPTKLTAETALARDDLFVAEQDGEIVGTAIINQVQVDVYAGAGWSVDAAADEVMVLHTLAISPNAFGRGYGKALVAFYEQY
ncbi:MAG: GNAT family N-acetyltransferase, partial [Clostridia bacterium]|nr:GNAT family N-acetyltransferase [Clostridia bacterium]